MEHKFSVEVEPSKRDFIMAAHTDPGQKAKYHLFADVRVLFDLSGHCYTCDCVHGVPQDIDLLFCGPSCKSLSKMFNGRDAFKQCYSTGDGSSGYTYLHGLVAATRVTNPAVVFF